MEDELCEALDGLSKLGTTFGKVVDDVINDVVYMVRNKSPSYIPIVIGGKEGIGKSYAAEVIADCYSQIFKILFKGNSSRKRLRFQYDVIRFGQEEQFELRDLRTYENSIIVIDDISFKSLLEISTIRQLNTKLVIVLGTDQVPRKIKMTSYYNFIRDMTEEDIVKFFILEEKNILGTTNLSSKDVENVICSIDREFFERGYIHAIIEVMITCKRQLMVGVPITSDMIEKIIRVKTHKKEDNSLYETLYC